MPIKRHIFGGWDIPTIEELRANPHATPSAWALCGNAVFEGIGYYLALPTEDFRPSQETDGFCLTCLRIERAAIAKRLPVGTAR